MITLTTLFSGSSGNCTLVRSEQTAILVDAGRNCKAVTNNLAALGMTLNDISAIFITHEHSDHISALDVMMRRCPIPIHMTTPSAREICKKESAAQCAVVHPTISYEVQVGDLFVRSFPLPHDSAAHVGYIICDSEGDRAGVATDIGYITPDAVANLSGCRCVVLEANHDVQMLRFGEYPYYLKQRILSKGGHLSNVDSACLCTTLAETGTERIMLAHLSRDNNTPHTALSCVRGALDEAGHESVTLKVALRESPLEL